jgi:hypothetical protein
LAFGPEVKTFKGEAHKGSSQEGTRRYVRTFHKEEHIMATKKAAKKKAAKKKKR